MIEQGGGGKIVQVDSQGNAVSGSVAGAGGGLVLHTSPVHFTAAFYDADSLTLYGHPAITDHSQFVEIEAWSAAGVYIGKYSPRTHVFEWDSANDRVNVSSAAFVTGGTYKVSLLAADRFANLPGNHLLSAEVNPYETRGESAMIPLITAPQNFTAAWADLGPEISLYGYNKLKLWLTLDINDSTDLRVRVVEKHESGGVEEYPMVLEAYNAADVRWQPGYWEMEVDADTLAPLIFRADGLTPVGQVQIMAGTLGVGTDAQMDAAGFTRGTFGG
jgi:hypothetical protein